MNGFKSCKKPAENEKTPRNLKFFRHLELQEKVRGEGTHFKVPWATRKPIRLGRDIWKGETFRGGSPGVAGTSGFRNHNPLWIRYEFLVNPRWIRYESHVGADFFLFSRDLFWWREQSSAGLIVMILWSWKIPEWSTRESILPPMTSALSCKPNQPGFGATLWFTFRKLKWEFGTHLEKHILGQSLIWVDNPIWVNLPSPKLT